MRIALIFAVAVLFSFVADAIAVPRTVPWRRAPLALALHALALLFLCAIFLLPSARPMFAAVCAVALLVVMGVVSNAKFKTLREPFVFSDLSLFVQLFRYPRLYLPFLGFPAILGAGVGAVALALGCWAEPAIAPYPWRLALLMIVVCVVLGYGVAAFLPLTLDVDTDQRRHGFFTVFVAYLLNGLRPSTVRILQDRVAKGPFADDGGEPAPAAEAAFAAAAQLPDVIVIQSESYFDAREISAAIDPAVYAQFDRACRESVVWGRLTVPAWGANTMRSEFSFLTGLASESLGYARFYPYAFLRRACASLPGWFKRHGYRTLAMHPYHGDFFGRDRVFPLLHFDQFQDISHFAQAPHAGPYVSDAALADAILGVLDEAPRNASSDMPSFVFAMTMENHGPLHLEAVRPEEVRRYHALGEGKAWRNLTVYLRHVANADAMLGNLLACLRTRPKPVVVCFYGDHVPALSGPFRALGVMPDRSSYLIWRNFGDYIPTTRRDVRIEMLAPMTLAAVRGGRPSMQENVTNM